MFDSNKTYENKSSYISTATDRLIQKLRNFHYKDFDIYSYLKELEIPQAVKTVDSNKNLNFFIQYKVMNQ